MLYANHARVYQSLNVKASQSILKGDFTSEFNVNDPSWNRFKGFSMRVRESLNLNPLSVDVASVGPEAPETVRMRLQRRA